MISCSANDEQVLRWLCEGPLSHIPIDAQVEGWLSPMHRAIIKGHVGVLKYLIEEKGLAKSYDDLVNAVCANRPEVVRYLAPFFQKELSDPEKGRYLLKLKLLNIPAMLDEEEIHWEWLTESDFGTLLRESSNVDLITRVWMHAPRDIWTSAASRGILFGAYMNGRAELVERFLLLGADRWDEDDEDQKERRFPAQHPPMLELGPVNQYRFDDEEYEKGEAECQRAKMLMTWWPLILPLKVMALRASFQTHKEDLLSMDPAVFLSWPTFEELTQDRMRDI